MSATTLPATAPGDALMDLEPALHDMRNATAMLGHMATSDAEVLTEHLHFIEDRLIAAHRRLESLWQQVWEDRKAEHAQHEAELAKAKAEAEDAAPGSVKQIKRAAVMLSLLRAGTQVMSERVAEMEAEVTAAFAEREEPA